jgi:hypothetical protein
MLKQKDKLEETKLLISEITLLSTCLINSVDKLLELRIEGKPLARQKLKQSAKVLLKELTKSINSQSGFYDKEIIDHLNSSLVVVEEYASLFYLGDLPKMRKTYEYYKTL